MLTVSLLLAVLAFGFAVAAAIGKVPLWIAVLLSTLAQLTYTLPLH